MSSSPTTFLDWKHMALLAIVVHIVGHLARQARRPDLADTLEEIWDDIAGDRSETLDESLVGEHENADDS